MTFPLTPKRPIDMIVIHHSATPPGRDVTMEEIKIWHVERGFDDIGYHDIIEIDGKIREGRDREKIGAHCKGHNEYSIGVCLVGDGRKGFFPSQEKSLAALLRHYRRMFPGVKIVGHRDLAATECPGFDVAEWLERNGLAYAG